MTKVRFSWENSWKNHLIQKIAKIWDFPPFFSKSLRLHLSFESADTKNTQFCPCILCSVVTLEVRMNKNEKKTYNISLLNIFLFAGSMLPPRSVVLSRNTLIKTEEVPEWELFCIINCKKSEIFLKEVNFIHNCSINFTQDLRVNESLNIKRAQWTV